MTTSGTQVTAVWVWAECTCTPETGHEHTCTWHGGVDALIDPEAIDGYDAYWNCPNCGCQHVKKEGTW